MPRPLRQALQAACVVCLIALSAACAKTGTGRVVPAGTAQPDQFLYDQGQVALAKEKWLTAREYFKQLSETYVQSPLRPDAKLAVGDTYVREGGSANLVLAINQVREFLSFYPLHRRYRFTH